MAANEQHHYVPQFYLKNFSIDGDRVTVQLYNHETSLFIPKSTIKGQAKEKFLYGKDDSIEKDLSKLEGAVSNLFHDPITKITPPIEPENYKLLLEFIIIQLFRTKKAARNLLNDLNSASKTIATALNISFPPGGKLVHERPALVSLYHAIDHLPLMNHLAVKSIVNLTKFPFITSDAPVALYNQWMEKGGTYIGSTAIAVKGLQIFLPIHPRLMYCLYDPYLYSCGTDENLIVKLETESDIHQLNALQYLFSDSHLYSDNQVSREYMEYIINETQKYRIEERSNSKIETAKQPHEQKSQVRFFNSFEDPHFNLALSFFEIKSDFATVPPKNGLPELRHASFEQLLINRS